MKAFSTVEEFKKIQTKNEQEYQRKIEIMTKNAKEELGKLDQKCQQDIDTRNTEGQLYNIQERFIKTMHIKKLENHKTTLMKKFHENIINFG